MKQLFYTQPLTNGIKVNVPGKLYIAGEYMVLEPGHSAILVAIDAYLSLKVTANLDKECTVNSPLLSEKPFEFGQSTIEDKWGYVNQAIFIFKQLLVELNIKWRPCHIDIDSNLADGSGKKYGLGSSGTVVIGIIDALSQWHGIHWDSRLSIYKLSTIASIQVSNKGSFGDIAASSFGGWVRYRSFGRLWLMEQINKQVPLMHLLSSCWPKLKITPFKVTQQIQFAIGWTQAPASTDYLVQQFDNSNITVAELLAENEQIIERLFQALINQDVERIQSAINQSRHLLEKIALTKGIQIETPKLKQLISLAHSLDWVAKTSGAGGGDCGIALADSTASKESLFKLWQDHQIEPLPFQITQPFEEAINV